ncbi:DUF488 domain-containing protein [Diaminobutyricimonas sp. LJ205]|uniref:DUF488 domain-containing protein n=1 Tax=Diaminobutyricimonas sp. LJ205 TaxID=2683590 RepID=UPI0012F4D565|nr:DUF488 family protein [Diaminobutyricimonas sp. LJ205]
MAVRLKRVYDDADEADGFRVLVDRLWPRGVTKERASVDLWLKDVAPSPELRKDWHHHPEQWDDFAARYRAELEDNPAVAELERLTREHPTLTLLYGAKDPVVNHARVLLDVLHGR